MRKRVGGPEDVQLFSEIASLGSGRATFRGGDHQAIDERIDRGDGRDVGSRRLDGLCYSIIIGFLRDVRKHELIAMPRHRPDEPRIPRVVTERASKRADRLRQRPIGDDDVAPHFGKNRVFGHGISPSADQQNQEIEVFRNEWHRLPVPQQESLTRRDHELGEAEADGGSHAVSAWPILLWSAA